jgi:hypothetical protein
MLTTVIDRERFRLMDKSYEETNSVFTKPIFKDYINLACQRTIHVQKMLQEEQKLLED